MSGPAVCVLTVYLKRDALRDKTSERLDVDDAYTILDCHYVVSATAASARSIVITSSFPSKFDRHEGLEMTV